MANNYSAAVGFALNNDSAIILFSCTLLTTAGFRIDYFMVGELWKLTQGTCHNVYPVGNEYLNHKLPLRLRVGRRASTNREELIVKMLRHYFISDSLDDLEVFEEQLEAAGVSTPQIHVLSRNDAEVEHHHHLHEVQSIMKNDIIHLTMRGAFVGVCAFVLILLFAYFAGWNESAAGWMPVIFLAVIVLGFSTWEGGYFGIHRTNHNFARFEKALSEGKHVFFVDLEPKQEAILERILKLHPTAETAGTGRSTRHWLIALQQKATMVRHS